MSKGVDKTKKTVESLSSLVADIVAIIQGGLTINAMPKIFEIINDIRQLIESAPGAFPELQELEALEASELGASAYHAIQKIIVQVKAAKKHG